MSLEYELVTENPLVHNPDSILLKQGEPVVDFENRSKWLSMILRNVIDDNNAYGAAANQIGLTDDAFCVKVGDTYKEFFNSSIVYYGGDMKIEYEGCLSYPDLFVKIKRPDLIRIQYFDIDGKEQTDEFFGLPSRVIQHEYDHVSGVRFFDRATRYHMDSALRKLKQAKRRKK